MATTYQRQLERRIKKKEQEIQELQGEHEALKRRMIEIEASLREAKASLEAYQDSLNLAPESATEMGGGTSELRKGSLPAMAYEALRESGSPLHITDLLRAMGKDPTRKMRTSLAGSLSAYVRRGEWFRRPEPNTFALVEWGEVEEEEPEDGLTGRIPQRLKSLDG